LREIEQIRIEPNAAPTVTDIKPLWTTPKDSPKTAMAKPNSPLCLFENAAQQAVSLFFPIKNKPPVALCVCSTNVLGWSCQQAEKRHHCKYCAWVLFFDQAGG
jgi:hypothetical protein